MVGMGKGRDESYRFENSSIKENASSDFAFVIPAF